MKLKRTLIIIAFATQMIVSCMTARQDMQQDKVNKELGVDVYVSQVISMLPYDAPHRLVPVELTENLSYEKNGETRHAVGLCRSLKNGKPYKIYFDKLFWENSSDIERLGLVLHEIMHCSYNMKHTKGGIMHPTIDGTVKSIVKYGFEEAIARAFDGSDPLLHDHKH